MQMKLSTVFVFSSVAGAAAAFMPPVCTQRAYQGKRYSPSLGFRREGSSELALGLFGGVSMKEYIDGRVNEVNDRLDKIEEGQEKLNNKIEEGQEKLNNKIEEGQEKLNNKIEEGQEKLNNKIDKKFETLKNGQILLAALILMGNSDLIEFLTKLK